MGKKSVKPVLSFNVSIKGDKWLVRLYTDKLFTEVYGHNVGMCEYDHKLKDLSINFNSAYVTKDTIAHELQHAFLSYKFFHPKAKPETVEERVCESTGKHYKRLYDLVNVIYSKFREFRKNARD